MHTLEVSLVIALLPRIGPLSKFFKAVKGKVKALLESLVS